MIAPGADKIMAQLATSTLPITAIDGVLDPAALTDLSDIQVVAATGASPQAVAYRRAMARRAGPILPLVAEPLAPERYLVERHLCIDTTAAGGNASLLAST